MNRVSICRKIESLLLALVHSHKFSQTNIRAYVGYSARLEKVVLKRTYKNRCILYRDC